MRRILLITIVISVLITLLCALPAMSQDVSSDISPTIADETNMLTSSELDDLLGEIALYPDPLLAQLLPAATYPDQLLQAYQLIQLKGGDTLIDDQDWDVSVKAIAHYPSVIEKMINNPDWSDAVGQAYINQPEDVMKSIQRLRGKAKLLGYLSSNEEQEVITDSNVVMIVPAQPEYIYVPVYDPQVVYIVDRPHYNTTRLFISFGSGFSIGSWLNRDCDWHHHRVYYHGWRGHGWIERSRRHVVINNNIYVNNRYHYDKINDRHRYRDNFDRERQRSYERRIQPRYKNQPGYHMPAKPDPKFKIYDIWKQQRDKYRNDQPKQNNKPRMMNGNKETNKPARANVINPWKTQRQNNGKKNNDDTIRSNKPNQWNAPKVNNDRQIPREVVRPDVYNSENKQRKAIEKNDTQQPTRTNTINPWNTPKVNNDRQIPREVVRPDMSNSDSKQRNAIDRKETQQPTRANVINPWSAPRVNNERNIQKEVAKPDASNQGNKQTVNNKKDQDEKVKQDKPNSWGTRRNK